MKRLLLVDDSEVTLELLQQPLADAGFDVRVAMSTAEAMMIARVWQPDIAIVDLRRPDHDEGALCAALRAETKVGVLLVASSLSDPELVRVARRWGADGHISKNKGVKAYVSRVEELVRTKVA